MPAVHGACPLPAPELNTTDARRIAPSRTRLVHYGAMGFMDKAKKMAEQAQAKLEEAQKQFNAGQSDQQPSPDPVVEYDKHGRPIAQPASESSTPPQGDPLAGSATP